MPIVPDIACDDVSSAAGTGCGYLHRVLEIRHRKLGCVADVFGIGGCHGHAPRQFDNEVAGTQAATRGSSNIVELRNGVPRAVRGCRAIRNPVEEFRGRIGMRPSFEGNIDENVSVQQ